MPRNLRTSSVFERDLKRVIKQGKGDHKLKTVVDILFAGVSLPGKNKDHALIGKWNGCRECHIEPDWLLIYEANEEELFLHRTGSHAELFGK